ncbi:hydrogenase nickel incorporation protein HypB [Acerihabitans sp. TG2]|uniref:hydrogenase nickel incorporation protein HypB n=1 Tax=Acerihabitans sp. TG2 TaxID=3096008 RepID=UPI002B231D8A|nr:hydrogenase nickel incorporation protein HypB [Acerihabitans sp. TG2]MEA9391352.1 hydrogenase nickel incorporation protein HypB [Acerihabitans sp. TG2]
MCSTCGCAKGERHIEGDEPVQQGSHHEHAHEHAHPHDHADEHAVSPGGHEHTHDHIHDHAAGDGFHEHTHDHIHDHRSDSGLHGHMHGHDHTSGLPRHAQGHVHTSDTDSVKPEHLAARAYDRSSAALASRRVTLPANGAAAPLVIHHHHYHGEVHHHYYNGLPPAACRPEERDGSSMSGAIRQDDLPGDRYDALADDGYADLHAGPHDDLHSDLHSDPHADLHYGHGEAGVHAPGLSQRRLVEIEIDVLDKNNRLAAQNREHFQARHILALNLVSSPGSGKTTLLTETLQRLKDRISCAVIEGDQQTTNDADRIRATGAPAIQVNTGKGCHLDAQMIQDATRRLAPPDHSLLFIENVGNLVCPAGFDLGERHKVVVLSVTEGEDKPLKYPHMFAAADVMILNKTDLLPWVNFNVDTCIANARRVNPAMVVLMLSATTGDGMDTWISWLDEQRAS